MKAKNIKPLGGGNGNTGNDAAQDVMNRRNATRRVDTTNAMIDKYPQNNGAKKALASGVNKAAAATAGAKKVAETMTNQLMSKQYERRQAPEAIQKNTARKAVAAQKNKSR